MSRLFPCGMARREFLWEMGGGFAGVALTGMLGREALGGGPLSPKHPHHGGKAKACIFLFMCLHQIGAHYTYSRVPYDSWFVAISGRTFNSLAGWQRNNFDRVVHFSYGLLLTYPVASPVIWLTGNPVLAYNVLFLAAMPLNGLGAFALARELTSSGRAALVAGLAFAYAPYQAVHLSHIQLMTHAGLPLALFWLHR